MSVSTWKDPGLRRIAERWFAGKLVVIVNDADWHENPLVVRQSLLFRERLRDEWGINAIVAAPPHGDRDEKGELRLKGVDDFLADGGSLDDLLVLKRDAPFSLALHADKDGRICGTIRGLATILGVRKSPESVRDELERYIDRDWLMSDRPLELVPDEWTGALGWGKREDWPTFTIREDLRATQEFVRLGDYSGEAPTTLYDAVLEEAVNAWLSDDGPRFIGPRHLQVAVTTTAQRLNLKPGTVRSHPAVKMLHDGHRGVRSRLVRHWRAKGENTTEIALALDVSPDTVERILKEERMTTAEQTRVIERIDRMEARLAETLLSIQKTVDFLAEKNPETDFSNWTDWASN